jgi:uracil-DNA glycosylase family 4
MYPNELANALRCRFEADEFLGADVLPVRLPAVMRGTAARSRSAGGEDAPARYGAREEATVRGAAATSQTLPDVTPLPPREPISAEEAEERRVQLTAIDDNEVKTCTRCGLATTRTKTVFGVGSSTARIVFVGEAPGHDEDVSGEPFVGRAGRLLTDMIEKGMGLRRQDVYICNVLKCRPPNNRTPASDEIAACRGYLWRQLEIIRPQLIIALGAPAAQTLFGTKEGIGRLRGRFHDFYPSGTALVGEPVPLLPTFHPAYLLRSPGEKAKAWADLKLAMALLGIPLPKRK